MDEFLSTGLSNAKKVVHFIFQFMLLYIIVALFFIFDKIAYCFLYPFSGWIKELVRLSSFWQDIFMITGGMNHY